MASSDDILTIHLSKPTTPEALRAFRAEVVRLLEAGTKALLVDIDEVGTLDSPTIAALIVALRAARERSAVLSLQVSRKNLLETLRITALDQVFTIVLPLAALAEAAPVKRVRRPRQRRTVAAIAWMAAITLLAGARTEALPDVAPADVVRNVAAQNARLDSYEANVDVNVHLRSFPYLADRLNGTAYFKQPDRFEVVFQSVPAVAKGFDHLYSDIDDPIDWERRFDLSYAGEKTIDGHSDVVLRLVQKVRGMIDHEDVAIDPATWHVDSMEWHYYNGGTIAMTQQYRDAGGYDVLAAQHATIRIPYVHAAADATYSDYKTNVAIDDGVFTAAHP
jgi:anti-anti-sigma regulatory factor